MVYVDSLPNSCFSCKFRDRYTCVIEPEIELRNISIAERSKFCPLKELIRYKNCKYAPGNTEGYNCLVYSNIGILMKDPHNFYCSDGRRKI